MRKRSGRAIIAATIAGALLAFGGLALAQSEEAGGDSVVAAPVPFSGQLGCGTAFGSGATTAKAEVIDDPDATANSFEGVIWRFPVVDISDPRLDGRVLGHLAGTEFEGSDFDDEGVYSALWQVTNDGGSWVGPYTTMRFPEDGYATNSIRLVGQDGYEGQFALLQTVWREDCGWDIQGYIVDRDVPDFPAAVIE